ncbi:ApeI family dehydratase [Lonepinella sp. BR2271]|uniref:ApeI family dehydratase n=1 Tax=Lonepinella sp. BR2271 TaxID=3434550 RepID=UPI003F6E2C8A
MPKPTNPIWLSQTQTDNGYSLTGKIPPDLRYFAGHFADFPLVPGVVELQWVMGKGRELFAQEICQKTMVRVDNLKFQKFLRPDDVFCLQLAWQADKNRLAFKLLSENSEPYASGFVLFEEKHENITPTAQ